MVQLGTTVKGFERGPIIAPSQPTQMPWEESATQKYALGCTYKTDDGRVFKYALAGATALAAGELQQAALYGGAVGTVQHDLTPSAAVIGATTVYATTVTDTTPANQFADGWMCVTDGGAAIGQGEMYKIVSHTGGAAGLLRFDLNRPLVTAWTASTRVSILGNIYKSVIQTPITTPTGICVGVPIIPVTAAYYCWLQTWGICNVLIKTALTMGTNVLLDVAAAGSAGVDDGALINTVVGAATVVVDTTDSGPIFLKITPW